MTITFDRLYLWLPLELDDRYYSSSLDLDHYRALKTAHHS